VVEDERRNREALVRLLEEEGYDVRAAASAEQADSWITAMSFDLVLLDIELPGMNGVEFLEWALDRDPQLAIIMTTGVDVPEVALRCLRAGARTYLVKPLDPAFTREAVRDALVMREVLKELDADALV
jgi:CheY-like chemotaxis protein